MNRLKSKEVVANQSGAMEADTILKNGRSSKSHTSRDFLKFVGLLLTMCFILTLSGCDKDKDKDKDNDNDTIEKITAIFENFEEYNDVIEEVRMVTWVPKGQYEYDKVTVATGKYRNGFTVELPKTIDTKYLTLINDDILKSVNVSNKNAKLAYFYSFYGYDKYGEPVVIEYGTDEDYHINFSSGRRDNYYQVMYVYADSDVSISGTKTAENQSEKTVYSINFRKGWNIMYQSAGVWEFKDGKTTYTFIQTTELAIGEIIWIIGNFLAG